MRVGGGRGGHCKFWNIVMSRVPEYIFVRWGGGQAQNTLIMEKKVAPPLRAPMLGVQVFL